MASFAPISVLAISDPGFIGFSLAAAETSLDVASFIEANLAPRHMASVSIAELVVAGAITLTDVAAISVNPISGSAISGDKKIP